MSGKLIASFLLAGGLAVAIGAGFLVAGTIFGVALLMLALGQLVLAHLAFLEDRKRRSGAVGSLSWLNLGMSYLLVAMALGLFLMKTLLNDDIAPGGEIARLGDPGLGEGNVVLGEEIARLGNSGLGEGNATTAGAIENNQTPMSEKQVSVAEIAENKDEIVEKVDDQIVKVPDPIEPAPGPPTPAGVDKKIVDVGKHGPWPIILPPDDNFLPFSNPEPNPKDRNDTRTSPPRVGFPKSMSGRCDKLGRIVRLRRAGVQNPAAVELAVAKALDWLTLNQNDDGSWGKTFHGAMTGFALLCYLGHCDLTDSAKYGGAVFNGIKFLVELGEKKNGWLYTTKINNGTAYAHGIATYAMAESYAMTEKGFILPVLQKAVRHIVDGQRQNGGWYYDYNKRKNESDTSVSGWQFQALKAAYNTGARFPGIEPALGHAVGNFYRVYENGSFGYREQGDTKNHNLTGVGALGLQAWKFGHPSVEERKEVLQNAVQHIMKKNHGVSYGSKDSNLYSWYYDTQALFNYGGLKWASWNLWMEPMLLRAQKEDGAWPSEGSGLTSKAREDAEIYRTALCTLILEVYYRYVY